MEGNCNLLAFVAKPPLTFLTLNLGKSLSLPACFIPAAVAVVLPMLPVLLLRRRLYLGGPSGGSHFGGFAAVLAMVALLLMIWDEEPLTEENEEEVVEEVVFRISVLFREAADV